MVEVGTMIPSSAFVTVGESARTLAAVEAGHSPSAEYAVLRANHFSKVVAMVDSGIAAGSLTAEARFAAAAYSATWDCENVYLGEEFPGIQYLALQALLRRPKRIAMLVHNTASLRRRVPLATLGLSRFADHYLCLSQRSKADLERAYRVPASRITVVHSRVDTAFFTPQPSAAVATQVCSAGAVNRDYATLIEAVRPLGIPLKIAADTAWKHSTGVGNAHESVVPAFVEMRSWGSYEKLRELYARSAVVVVPLEKPMLSGITVALEAMAMGRPVILTRNDYVEDFVQDGENGLLTPAHDPEALRTRIRQLLDDPALAERLGACARQSVLERFTVATYVKKLLSVWQ